MPEVIDDPSSAELLSALEANMIAFWLPYGRALGSRFASDATVTWFYTGVAHPLFNGVVSARLPPQDVRPLVDTLAGLIRDSGAPALWWVGPLSLPDDLGATLEQTGLQAAGAAPAMAIDLSRLPDAPPPIERFVVKPVEGSDAQALWARTAALGSELPPDAADGLAALETRLSDPTYRAQRRYIGYLDGAPVAASALVLESGVAGIYAVATAAEARNRGIGRFMTLAPFIAARDEGYRVGILQASSMGYPLYAKLGFTDVGSYRLYLQTA